MVDGRPRALRLARAQGVAGVAPAAEPGGPDGALPPGRPYDVDPLDRLEKLAALHERGVLTDAEFAREKQKILGAPPD